MELETSVSACKLADVQRPDAYSISMLVEIIGKRVEYIKYSNTSKKVLIL